MKNNVEITVANTKVVDISADVDVALEPNPDAPDAKMDLADLMWAAVVERTKDKVPLDIGKYNIRMLCVITLEE